MPEVKCSYCGTMLEFRDAIHRESGNGPFVKYYHFCDNKHLARWTEERQQKESPVAQSPMEHTEIM